LDEFRLTQGLADRNTERNERFARNLRRRANNNLIEYNYETWGQLFGVFVSRKRIEVPVFDAMEVVYEE
jgi:hypothetical protein